MFLDCPDLDVKTTVRAVNCPFCDDLGVGSLGGSYLEVITGGFYPSGAGRLKEDDEDTFIPSTVIVDIQESNEGYQLFFLKKGSEDAKPIRG